MIPDLKALLARLLEASTKAKVVAALVGLGVVAIISVAGVVARQPHFALLYSGLSAAESAAVQKALAEEGVRFKVSQPPAPYFIHVDESEYYVAQNGVAKSGALDRAPVGIHTQAGGASSVFMSSGERSQSVLKREWQEMERQLEALQFVSRALVTTSIPDHSPLRRGEKMTASVMLTLRGGAELTPEQARTVARLVRFRFNIPTENLVISDHNGKSLHDPLRTGPERDVKSLIEHSADYDRGLAQKANEALEFALGAGKAFVTINSEWDHDQSTVISEVVDPTKVVVSEETSKTETPQGGGGGAAGGVPGVASNLIGDGFGVDNAGFGSETPAAAAEAVATTKDESKLYETGRSTTHRVRTAPVLQRLSVSLFLDESLSDRQEELEAVVKAAVGFQENGLREDSLRSIVTPLSQVQLEGEEVAEGEGGEEAAPPAGPNPMVEMLLEYGVEIVAALGFLFLLFKSLKGAATRSVDGQTGGEDQAALDPEALARAQIEELVRSEPDRVGEILARWAREGELAETSA